MYRKSDGSTDRWILKGYGGDWGCTGNQVTVDCNIGFLAWSTKRDEVEGQWQGSNAICLD